LIAFLTKHAENILEFRIKIEIEGFKYKYLYHYSIKQEVSGEFEIDYNFISQLGAVIVINPVPHSIYLEYILISLKHYSALNFLQLN
jgi:hypothetical protein